MDVMGCKYFDVDGLPVSHLEDLVRYNRAGKREQNDLKTLDEYLAGEMFFDSKGIRMNVNIKVPQKKKEPEQTTQKSYALQPATVRPTVLNPTVPKVSSARSLVPNNVTAQAPRPTIVQQPVTIRRPSFNNTFSSFVADQEKNPQNPPNPPIQRNSNSSLFQRSMTQFGMGNLGNRKIVLKPKPAAATQRPAPYTATPPAKTVPAKEPRYHIIQKQSVHSVPKVISVRPNAAPQILLAGGGGTQYKQHHQNRNEPAPAVSGGGGTQFGGQHRNEPAPAVSGGSGTQFGKPGHRGNDAPPAAEPSAPKIARILHRRHTLFQK